MIVMSALAISAAFFSGCGRSEQTDKTQTARLTIKLLDDAIQQYKLDVGTYPSELECLMQNLDRSDRWDGPYLKPKVPLDPWGFEYHYVVPGRHGEFDLCTFGADGQEGGEGENTDWNNWE